MTKTEHAMSPVPLKTHMAFVLLPRTIWTKLSHTRNIPKFLRQQSMPENLLLFHCYYYFCCNVKVLHKYSCSKAAWQDNQELEICGSGVVFSYDLAGTTLSLTSSIPGQYSVWGRVHLDADKAERYQTSHNVGDEWCQKVNNNDDRHHDIDDDNTKHNDMRTQNDVKTCETP
eukprot:2118558-Amphidinium_carterae.1